MPYVKVPKLSGSHPLVVSNGVMVRLHWSLNGKLAYNVLGGSVGGGYTNSQAHADALTTAVLAAFTSSGLKALSASTTTLIAAGIRDIRTANLTEYVGSGTPVAGTGAGDPLPNTNAAVVTLRTALAGKHYRGRVFISGANEAQNDAAGHIATAYNTACAAFVTAVQSAMGTEGISLAVLSRPNYLNLAPPADVQTYAGAVTPVTAIVTRDVVWDSQRSRKG